MEQDDTVHEKVTGAAREFEFVDTGLRKGVNGRGGSVVKIELRCRDPGVVRTTHERFGVVPLVPTEYVCNGTR